MLKQSAQESHILASKIKAATLSGDHETANRLIAEFNERLFGSTTTTMPQNPGGQVGNLTNQTVNSDNSSSLSAQTNQSTEPPTTAIDAKMATLRAEYENLIQQKQQLGSPAMAVSNAVSAIDPNRIPTLAEAVQAEAVNKTARPSPPADLPIGASATDQDRSIPPVPSPVAPTFDFKAATDEYQPGVQALLKQYLTDFAAELEIPPAVLGSVLLEEFENLWRERQAAEPLLLKLPEHIQQRSVLLRFKDQLQERLE